MRVIGSLECAESADTCANQANSKINKRIDTGYSIALILVIPVSLVIYLVRVSFSYINEKPLLRAGVKTSIRSLASTLGRIESPLPFMTGICLVCPGSGGQVV